MAEWLKHLERGPQKRVFGALIAALFRPGRTTGKTLDDKLVTYRVVVGNLLMALVPLILTVVIFSLAWWFVTVRNAPEAAQPQTAVEFSTFQGENRVGGADEEAQDDQPAEGEPEEQTLQQEAPAAEEAPGLVAAGEPEQLGPPEGFYEWFFGLAAFMALVLIYYYRKMDGEQLEILKMVEASVMPLAVLTLSVLGSNSVRHYDGNGVGRHRLDRRDVPCGHTKIPPAHAVGWPRRIDRRRVAGLDVTARRYDDHYHLRRAGRSLLRGGGRLDPRLCGTASDRYDAQSVFLTAKTTAMVCWLFVGSALFSAVFALHGGRADHRALGAQPRSVAVTIHDHRPVHHLHPGLAARMD